MHICTNASANKQGTSKVVYAQIIHMQEVYDLCKRYNIEPFVDNNEIGVAMGIGDCLRVIQALKLGTVKAPVNINLFYFIQNNGINIYPNPLNQLEFRLQLFQDLLRANHLPEDSVRYIMSHNTDINTNHVHNLPFRMLEFQQPVQEPIFARNTYIIFHTKLRLIRRCNYDAIKRGIQLFCKNFKTTYTCILLGEQAFPHTYEVDAHGITTCYNELTSLKENNKVIDLTQPQIYNDLNFNHYKSDIQLIQLAKLNICFGVGGQLCTSLFFGQKTIFFNPPELEFPFAPGILDENRHTAASSFSMLDMMCAQALQQ